MTIATVSEIMSPRPAVLHPGSTTSDAARLMRDQNIGMVVLEEDSTIKGIVTDRDIVVRAIAEGHDPTQTRLSDICSDNLTSVSPKDEVGKTVELMRHKAIRRLPVVENDAVVGVVSIGDLALVRDPDSVLADISAAQPNT